MNFVDDFIVKGSLKLIQTIILALILMPFFLIWPWVLVDKNKMSLTQKILFAGIPLSYMVLPDFAVVILNSKNLITASISSQLIIAWLVYSSIHLARTRAFGLS